MMSRLAPYFAGQGVTLNHGDAFDVLPQLGRFPAAVTDPPYGQTPLAWDVYPVGWPGLVAGHTASLWCFGSMRLFLDHAQDFAGWRLAQDIVWRKHNGSSPATDRFRRVHEHVTHWYRGRWRDVYHHTPRIQAGPSTRGNRRPVRRSPIVSGIHGGYGASTWVETGTRLAESVLDIPKNRAGKSSNPTQKPVALLELLVTYSVPPGGVALDPFAGTGSTAVAARRTGRRAVLIEKREDQCEAAARRLAQDVLDLDTRP